MRLPPAAIRSALFCLFYVAAAIAQRSEAPAWQDVRSKNPQGVELSLRLADPHRYREGELIRAQITFQKRNPGRSEAPRREHWQFAGFLLDPVGKCGSLSSPCFQSMNFGFD